MLAGRPLPAVAFERGRVRPDLSCGSLDGAKPSPGAGVFVWGWAFDPRNGNPAAAVLLLANGRQVVPPIRVFLQRPDVAAEKGDRRLLPSGWNVWVPDGRLVGGPHDLEAFAVLGDGRLGPLLGKIRLP